MSAKALRVDARADLVIVGFDAVVIRGLIGGMIGVNILDEFDIVAVATAAIALEVFVTVSCVGDVRAGVWARTRD